MIKIAIFYTGLVRTLESTIPHIVNFLNNENYINNCEFGIFCSLQSNSVNEQNYINQTLLANFGNKIKSISWIDKNANEWQNLSTQLVSNIDISESWKGYLLSSGSMIEYYQMYNSYSYMKNYERENNINYDFVLRLRTDVILKDKINFNFQSFTPSLIKEQLIKAQNILNKDSFINKDVFNYFMNTFAINNRKTYDINKISISQIHENSFDGLQKIDLNEEEYVNALYNYIQNGDFLLTLRNNVVYFGKAKVFEKIHKLGINYGAYKIAEEPTYWFNAECQLSGICRENNIDYYSSVTNLEGDSLYNYNQSNYFDNNNNKLISDRYSFFIKRV
jgi:hypothetical protein